MTLLRLLACCFLALLPEVGRPALAAESAELPVLRWVVQDIPPHFHYVNGRPPQRPAELGRGELDGFMRVLIARLPQYRHEFVDLNPARFEILSRSGETFCTTLMMRTPQRLEWLYFSHMFPALSSRELHVIVRRDRLAAVASKLGPDERLDLNELLGRQDLRLVLERDRAFGPRIDALLTDKSVRRLALGGENTGSRLFDMLRAGRFDYTLDYPGALKDYLARPGLADSLVAVPIREGLSSPMADVACSRNAPGRVRLEAIDRAVRDLAADPRRAGWIRDWRPETPSPQDLKRLNAYMDERARGGARIE
jgi:uncharacterized protein (TIGR02285 family)